MGELHFAMTEICAGMARSVAAHAPPDFASGEIWRGHSKSVACHKGLDFASGKILGAHSRQWRVVGVTHAVYRRFPAHVVLLWGDDLTHPPHIPAASARFGHPPHQVLEFRVLFSPLHVGSATRPCHHKRRRPRRLCSQGVADRVLSMPWTRRSFWPRGPHPPRRQ
jgi:hypothetical protein